MLDLDVVDGDGQPLRLSLTDFGVRLLRPGKLRTETLFECPIEDLACLGDGSFELSGYTLSSYDAQLHAAFEEAVLNEQARLAFERRADRVDESTGLPFNLGVPLSDDGPRWQYAVVNIGMYNSPARMASLLAGAGAAGWELITVYDKSSNWLGGMEKGFMLLKRHVPPGTRVDKWCFEIRH